jgi:hypothetical protein
MSCGWMLPASLGTMSLTCVNIACSPQIQIHRAYFSRNRCGRGWCRWNISNVTVPASRFNMDHCIQVSDSYSFNDTGRRIRCHIAIHRRESEKDSNQQLHRWWVHQYLGQGRKRHKLLASERSCSHILISASSRTQHPEVFPIPCYPSQSIRRNKNRLCAERPRPIEEVNCREGIAERNWMRPRADSGFTPVQCELLAPG